MHLRATEYTTHRIVNVKKGGSEQMILSLANVLSSEICAAEGRSRNFYLGSKTYQAFFRHHIGLNMKWRNHNNGGQGTHYLRTLKTEMSQVTQVVAGRGGDGPVELLA